MASSMATETLEKIVPCCWGLYKYLFIHVILCHQHTKGKTTSVIVFIIIDNSLFSFHFFSDSSLFCVCACNASSYLLALINNWTMDLFVFFSKLNFLFSKNIHYVEKYISIPWYCWYFYAMPVICSREKNKTKIFTEWGHWGGALKRQFFFGCADSHNCHS